MSAGRQISATEQTANTGHARPSVSPDFLPSEVVRLPKIADLIEAEAVTWVDGFAVRNDDGSLTWPDAEYDYAHVRFIRLMSAARHLRKIAARFTKKANK